VSLEYLFREEGGEEMQTRYTLFLLLALVTLGLVAFSLVAFGSPSGNVQSLGLVPCSEDASSPASDGRVFKLCDGETRVVIQVADSEKTGRMSKETAQEVANLLMHEWARMKQLKSQGAPIVVAHKGEPHTKRETRTWDMELDNAVKEGYRSFHDSSLGTNGISCDMCHPDAKDIHPQTYPKFQTQLKKVALLRDMINWCIENPLEGKKLADDDSKLKALEMYILWANKGEVLIPGKH
jgi:thiosulfate dehydrogenase